MTEGPQNPAETPETQQANGKSTEAAEQRAGGDSAAEVEVLKKKVSELEGQLKEKDQKYMYLYADFDNFKKRSIRERSDLIKYGWENVARDLLQVVDNLERALAHVPTGTNKVLTDGLNMVLDQFRSTLQKQGVEQVPAVEKDFDPNLHEAVAQEESDLPAGKVVKEHSRGYTLHGRLLRAARVVISGGKKDTGGGDSATTH